MAVAWLRHCFQFTCSCSPSSLTAKKNSHKLSGVNAPSDLLDPLERRVDELLAHLSSLRRENAALRTRVQEVEADRDRLTRTIDMAAEQLEALHERLPA